MFVMIFLMELCFR